MRALRFALSIPRILCKMGREKGGGGFSRLLVSHFRSCGERSRESASTRNSNACRGSWEAGYMLPCPPPHHWFVPKRPAGGRADTEWARRYGGRILTNLLVLGLSYMAGERTPAPMPGRFRLSEPQRRLTALVGRSLAPWEEVKGDVGRADDKFRALGLQVRESERSEGLTVEPHIHRAAPDVSHDLTAEALEVARSLDPYKSGIGALVGDAAREQGVVRVRKLEGLIHKPVVSDRLPFPDEPPSFNPTPFLDNDPDPTLALAFLDPRVVRRRITAKTRQWPMPRYRGPGRQLGLLYRKWDKSRRLHLVQSRLVPKWRRAQMTAVAKDKTKDRPITDRRGANGEEVRVPDGADCMACGPQFCELSLRASEKLLIGCSDLSDFYHLFLVSLERAASNAIGRDLPLGDFVGTRAYEDFCRGHWHQAGETVLACLATLPMGDHLAVGIAVRAHVEMLIEIGGCDPRYFVQNRFPFPRAGVIGGPGARVEAVVVDDHPVVEKIHRLACRATVPSPGTELLDRASSHYNIRGAPEKLSKAIRRGKDEVVIGAEILGDLGWVGAPRIRRYQLQRLTLRVAALGRYD